MELQPASFSGTYGELRGNHFHAGVDWRTNGRVGQPLHAIKDGYICRLSVSPTGYGNAVYINHGDGTMSVYGHMNDFRDDIAARIRREQYAKESYSVDFTLTEDEFPIEQGEVFGHSGNTGSSGGPHLHMEIRKDDGNLPLNYLADGTYPVEDKTSPTISRVGFYAYEDTTSVPLTSRLAMISSPQSFSGVGPVSEKFYVAGDAVDLMDKASSRYAVDRYTVY
ncbi:MAG: M23 family metallopeptidase, partial [Bacteroidales bacterium]|nr:M23 family metallopeptidase [Candidatus Equibacterium intestinale]